MQSVLPLGNLTQKVLAAEGLELRLLAAGSSFRHHCSKRSCSE